MAGLYDVLRRAPALLTDLHTPRVRRSTYGDATFEVDSDDEVSLSHASHLARHMRRATGSAPDAFRTGVLLR